MAIYSAKPIMQKSEIRNPKSENGFTLIELIVVFSVIAVLSTVGLASFLEYNRAQTLQAATFDFITMLQVARSRAQSQVVDINGQKACENDPPLSGYQVSLCSIAGSTACNGPDADKYDYALYPVCNGILAASAIDGKKFPTNISFDSSTNKTFFQFSVLTGGVIGASINGDSIKIDGENDKEKSVKVYSDGRIEIQ